MVLFSWKDKGPGLKVLNLLQSVQGPFPGKACPCADGHSFAHVAMEGRRKPLHTINQVRILYYCFFFFKIKLNFSNLKCYLQYKLSLYIQSVSIQCN